MVKEKRVNRSAHLVKIYKLRRMGKKKRWKIIIINAIPIHISFQIGVVGRARKKQIVILWIHIILFVFDDGGTTVLIMNQNYLNKTLV